jgi:hypothetical protein
MQHQEPHHFQDDQASRLRKMAGPWAATPGKSEPFALHPQVARSQLDAASELNPRVVLISEFPAMHGGFMLAWQLAKHFATDRRRTAIIDLAPSASRLPMHLEKFGQTESIRKRVCQPLWIETSLGRGLATWQQDADSNIDLIAQPAGQFPTAEQMPRIVEQLLRAISGRHNLAGGNRQCAWSNVILLSDAYGVPLDEACWQAADAIVMLLPESVAFCEQARTALSARLPDPSACQRRLILWKQIGPMSWLRGRQPNIDHRNLLDVECSRSFRVRWPQESHFLSNSSRYSRVIASSAATLATELNCVPLPPRARFDRPTGKTG